MNNIYLNPSDGSSYSENNTAFIEKTEKPRLPNGNFNKLKADSLSKKKKKKKGSTLIRKLINSN